MASRPSQGRIVGRDAEVGQLRDALAAVARGRGGLALVEGEPGIGKSALMSAALADAGRLGCQLLWAAADEHMGPRFPLRVMLDCLQVDARPKDPSRAEIAALLRGERPGGPPRTEDPVAAAVERLLRLVDQQCAVSPVVIVVDDLQWADEASLLMWHRLASVVEQVPLLLVGAHRPAPPHTEIQLLRRTVQDRHGTLIELGPLVEDATHQLVAQLVGAPPGAELRRLSRQAAGNPLYLCELVHAVVAECILVVNGTAELPVAGFHAPLSLASAVQHRLGSLSPEATHVLSWAALLGQEFTVTELAVVAGRSATELVNVIGEATAAAVVTEAGARLRFQYPLIRRMLYEAIPQAMRVALHRQAGQALAESGAATERVAEHLLAAAASVDRWVVGWLIENGEKLAARAPLIAVDLMERAVAHSGVDDDQRQVLSAHLATVQFRLGRIDQAEARARLVLAYTRDPWRAGQMHWILGYALHRCGRTEEAFAAVDHALAAPSVPSLWAARLQALRSLILAEGRGDPVAAREAAALAVAMGEEVGDRFAVGHALSSLFFVHAANRDYPEALAVVDRGLAAVGEEANLPDLRTVLLDHRVFALQNLDRLHDADATLRAVRELADRAGGAHQSQLHIAAGVHHYWVGRWDDALVDLGVASEDLSEPTSVGLRAQWLMLLLHGASALIAGHRDDRGTARARLQAGLDLGLHTASDRDNCDFLLAAESLAAERDGAPARALAVLSPVLDPTFGRTLLRHQWLPDVVRLALELGDAATARAAVEMCDSAAAGETHPARATAAATRCRGLLDGDAAALLSVAGHYRSVGRIVELAQTLEDAAVVLAQRDDVSEARDALSEAVEVYSRLGASWDLRRADVRVRPYGIRRSPSGPRRSHAGTASGWAALTPTELAVARFVAEGRSNPDIATELFVSRRTVQTHVQHILTKLDVHSRVEIARQAIENLGMTGESA